MNIEQVTGWLDKTLRVAEFDDVSNNGVQVARAPGEVISVAFAVDASLRAVEAAAKAGAQVLVVHHGLSWGGGIKRVTGGVYNVVRAAINANLAIYACHLPLDAHPTLGNNAILARRLGLKNCQRAFSYHGHLIGLVGKHDTGLRVGVCSGGAGEFAEEALRLGCHLYFTGEANWGECIAAENSGADMVRLGHYETETFGVSALAAAMKKALKIKTVDLTHDLHPSKIVPDMVEYASKILKRVRMDIPEKPKGRGKKK